MIAIIAFNTLMRDNAQKYTSYNFYLTHQTMNTKSNNCIILLLFWSNETHTNSSFFFPILQITGENKFYNLEFNLMCVHCAYIVYILCIYLTYTTHILLIYFVHTHQLISDASIALMTKHSHKCIQIIIQQI